MSLTELYTKEARVWIPDPDDVWRGAKLLEDYTGQKELAIEYEDSEFEDSVQKLIQYRSTSGSLGNIPRQSKISVKTSDNLPALRNPEILIGENDLTSLSYLHEPAVLYNLQVRFCERNDIYTYCGIVLVAFNPYEQLPIYDNDTIQAYSGQDMASMDPHIFAVAEEAFKRVSQFDENQSIIVSGESGAGKTVSAKYAMRYFATVCGAEGETEVEKKVLSSNPIMESIGNAKTTRNDNSSRFGKYIEIGFSKNNNIVGANMRTYLLEKSRVVFQASEERNYHIFYQLCAVMDNPKYQYLRLNHPDVYFFTNQGEAPVIDGVDDARSFEETREAFHRLGINDLKQSEIFRILAGILHMGNVLFQEDDRSHDSCYVPKNDKHLPIMTELLGIDEVQIRKWLCYKKLVTANEVLVKPLTRSQAYFSRDALAKHVYSQLFTWIVQELNKALCTNVKTNKFIGVLDIYGFETFEVNSFEQFCINYANEKLQQQFCLHVFKLEQEEYVKEQIEWSFIDFYDNQPCIDLIEGKLGILDLLDEECRMPKGSDKNWCQKLYEKHIKHKHFEKPRMSQTAFIIHHFADVVEYQIDGCLEKNRDTVLEEHINILKASQYELVAELFQDRTPAKDSLAPPGGGRGGGAAGRGRGGVLRAAKETPRGGQKSHKKTVGSQFRESLNFLMETLFSTTPHYVRCIKPNDYKMSFTFEPKRAVQQLRACGVLETIRISAAGYPSRWTYPEFFHRYRVLAKSKEIQRKDMRKTCENILKKLIEDRDKYQFGKTKIFFRAGQVAYLEKLRSDKLRACGVMIQKTVRGWLAKRRYHKMRKTALLVQRFGRGFLARKHAKYLRRTAAAIRIQKTWRRYYQRQKFLRIRSAIVSVQAFARGLFGRQRFTNKREEIKAVVIQKAIRGWLERQRFHKIVHGVIMLQSHVRRRAAKKELKQLRVEARSIEHVRGVAKGLENKIIQLQQKLDERNKEVSVLREDQVALNDLRNQFSKLQVTEADARNTASRVPDLEELIARLRQELADEQQEKKEIVVARDIILTEKDQIIDMLGVENGDLKDELEKLNEKMQASNLASDASMKQKLEEVNQQLQREVEMERSHHQRLIKDYSRLQQRFENLQGEMQGISPTGLAHRRSPSGISNISLESESSTSTEARERKLEEEESDGGYGSQRRKHAEGAENGEGKIPIEKSEIALMSRLQHRVKSLERDKIQLQREVDSQDDLGLDAPGSLDPTEQGIYDTIKLQELEIESSKLREELKNMRKSVADSTDFDGNGAKGGQAAKEFMDQFEAMADELNRRREECIQLRTLLASRTSGGIVDPGSNTDPYGGHGNIINEDGELEMAYKTQKDLNKLLENELQRTQKTAEQREKELRQQITELKTDNDRQQKLIGQNLTMTPEAKIEATMQHEITRLTSENLDLRETIDKQSEQIKKLKKALKIYAKRLKSTEGDWRMSHLMTKSMSIASDVQAELEREMAVDENMPVVRHYPEREFSGMYEYRKEDEILLVRNLIVELKPRMASQHLPGMPSYVLFMCIRHTDYLNDDEKVRTLLTTTINSIKKVVKKRQDDVELVTLWLANTCRLLHNLKQYSGEKTFQSGNTSKQNEHCLRNFDLSEYRQILSDLAVWIYQGLIKLMEAQIHPMIVGAVLEHEAIAGLSAGKPTGMRGRLLSQSDNKNKADVSLDSLMKAMNNFMRVLNVHAVDPELVKQVFRQLFYFICANALNNLLLRKDMCHWSKGMQMRYNLSHLEQWLRDKKLAETSGCSQALDPIIQASQLLQARKSEADVAGICEMCSRLTTSQIIKILNLYTPVNEFEERVPISFIRKIQEHLSSRTPPGVGGSTTQTLLMDTKYLFAVTFPFNPSNLGLESVVAPVDWGLGFLKRL